MPHISFRVTEQEKERYKLVAIKKSKGLTEIIKKHLNGDYYRLQEKHES